MLHAPTSLSSRAMSAKPVTHSLVQSRIVLLFVFSLLLAPSGFGAEKPYTPGKLMDVQQKSRDKVDMYLVNTPVTTTVPYFELTVEVGNTDYVAEYTPRHSQEELPQDWKPGINVEVRVEKRHLFLKRPDGSEMQWIITKRIPVQKKQE
jgi:hypothetical protein